MSNLYKLGTELKLIDDEIIDAEGEITPELEKRLDETSLSFNQKVGGIVKWTQNLKGKKEAIKEEVKRLQKRLQFAENLDNRLRDYMKSGMENAECKKIEFDTVTISIQKNPPSVEIENENVIPSDFYEVVETKKINKIAIKETLKGGGEISGAKLITDKTRLVIK